LPFKILKRYLPKNAEAASALVLTLLVIMLLSATVVSFIWTTRTEMLATRNYTSKVKAEMLANSATHQAMAKIQMGFNTTANMTGNYTGVVTTQSGAIHKYFFQNGTITRNCTVEQFSAGNMSINGTATSLSASRSNATAYLNNLSDPSSNSSATSNQWSITGNASERINVFMENVTTTVNGSPQLIGRIAYYVDDESTKLNVNNATGNRTTLNVGSSRSLSLSTAATANQSAIFTQIISGNATSSNATSGNNTDIKNWGRFFRPEQVTGAVSGFDPNKLPLLSAAPAGNAAYHTKKTPWGTDRLFINDLPIDSTANATASVNAIYEALSGKNATTMLASTANASASELIGQDLRNIYGTTFAEKYTDVGLKQIAANILQARHPNVLNDPTKSFNYNGSLLGATDMGLPSSSVPVFSGGRLVGPAIPKDYLGTAPYPILNEIGVTVCAGLFENQLYLHIRPFVSIFNPWGIPIPASAVNKWKIEMQIDSFTFRLGYKPIGQPEVQHTYGPKGYKASEPYGRNSQSETRVVRGIMNSNKQSFQLDSTASGSGGGLACYQTDGRFGAYLGSGILFSNGAYVINQDLKAGQILQFPCPPYHDLYQNNPRPRNESVPNEKKYYGYAYRLDTTGVERINFIRDIKIKFEYIRLVADSSDDHTIRDWLLGEDVEIECWLQKPSPLDPTWVDGFPPVPTNPGGLGKIVRQWQTKPPLFSIKRIGGALKPSLNTRATPTPSPTPTSSPSPTPSQRPSMLAWSPSGNATWVSSNASSFVFSSNFSSGNAVTYPSKTNDNEIPGDPTKTDSDIRYAFDPAEHHLDSNDWPKIEFTNPANTTNSTGVFTSPADLGKIQTNIQHRKLRFTTQHPKEVAISSNGTGNQTYNGTGNQTFIPDWAMLDVISFGTNSTTGNYAAPAPVNLNGKFYVPSGSPQPAARTAGLEGALKALDSATSLGNSFNATFTVPTNRSQYMGSSGNVSSTIAGHIGNLTWSTLNSTTVDTTTGNTTTGNATWGRGNSISDPGSRRKTAKFPANQFVLPAEVTEIRGISDVVPLDSYSTTNSTHIKANEGRLSSLFPGATTQSRFFTIYAYAQVGQLKDKTQAESDTNPFVLDAEVVTKTLVEVEAATVTSSGTTTPTPPPTYKVKKLYSQQIISQ